MVSSILKRLALAGTLALIAATAQAACPSPYTSKDAAGTSQNIAAQNDASNNCVFTSALETLQSGVIAPVIGCDSSAVYDASTNGSTEIISATSAKTAYICGFSIMVGATATNVKLVDGTGTNCATGTPVNLTPAFQLPVNGGFVDGALFYRGLKATNTNRAVCVNASAGNPVQVIVYYTKG